jgi:hypothetical protein
MKFEAKKKQLKTALDNVQAVTKAVGLGESNPPVRLSSTKKRLKIATTYAEASITDASIEKEGVAVVDMQSFQQALSVGGDKFQFSLGKSSAQFSCGRSKGAISLRDEFNDAVLKDAPKAMVHLAGFKDLLVNLALKGDAGDRTLHFDEKGGTVRGESTDGYRAVVVVTRAGEASDFNSVAISLLQKACDTLGKLVGDSNIGYDDHCLSVATPGLKAVVPLSDDPPLAIQEQLAAWLEGQVAFGSFTVKVKEMKDALSDAQGMVGSNVQAVLKLNVSGNNTDAVITGISEAGDIETAFTLDSTKLKTEVVMEISAPGLLDCLSFYRGETIKVSVYSEAMVLDLIEDTDWIESQTTSVPLVSVIDAELPKAKRKAKKKGKEEDEEKSNSGDIEEEPDDPPNEDDDGLDEDEPAPDEEEEEEEEEDEFDDED